MNILRYFTFSFFVKSCVTTKTASLGISLTLTCVVTVTFTSVLRSFTAVLSLCLTVSSLSEFNISIILSLLSVTFSSIVCKCNFRASASCKYIFVTKTFKYNTYLITSGPQRALLRDYHMRPGDNKA